MTIDDLKWGLGEIEKSFGRKLTGEEILYIIRKYAEKKMSEPDIITQIFNIKEVKDEV